MSELTQKQIDRQDFVDNLIYSLVNLLVPEGYVDKTKGVVYPPHSQEQSNYGAFMTLDWDIEWISDLRDNILSIIAQNIGVRHPAFLDEDDPTLPEIESLREQFEQAFYPDITEDNN